MSPNDPTTPPCCTEGKPSSKLTLFRRILTAPKRTKRLQVLAHRHVDAPDALSGGRRKHANTSKNIQHTDHTNTDTYNRICLYRTCIHLPNNHNNCNDNNDDGSSTSMMLHLPYYNHDRNAADTTTSKGAVTTRRYGVVASPFMLLSVDRYLQRYEPVIHKSNCDILHAPRLTLDDNSNLAGARVVNIVQGECAHVARRQQCDYLAGDGVTTCHLLCLRSTSTNTNGKNDALCSLAHIDRVLACSEIERMIYEHVRFHDPASSSSDNANDYAQRCFSKSKSSSSSNSNNDRAIMIRMRIHIVGGFNDEGEKSIQITTFLLHALTNLAQAYAPMIHMTLQTCLVGCMNTDPNSNGPIGRGLAIHIDTGEVRLCEVDSSVRGPDIPLRSCRIFSLQAYKLQVIHMPYPMQYIDEKTDNDDNNGESLLSNSCLLCIEPFMFKNFPELDAHLSYSDEELLSHISTSPMCETPSFCSDARQMLQYLKDHVWWEEFCGGILVYQRVGVNGWRRVMSADLSQSIIRAADD